MRFDFYDSRTTTNGLQNFSITITVDVKLNNMKIRCAAKKTEESKPVFNSFENIIIIEKSKSWGFYLWGGGVNRG